MSLKDPVARAAYEQEYRKNHKKENAAYHRSWRLKNIDKARAQARNKKRHGLTGEERKARFEAQGKICDLCKRPMEKTGHGREDAVLDHDHITGENRKFIHSKCNLIIGIANDDPQLCRLAAEYLERHGK